MKPQNTLELISFEHPRFGRLVIEQGTTTDDETLAFLEDILPDSPQAVQKRIRKIIEASRSTVTTSLRIKHEETPEK